MSVKICFIGAGSLIPPKEYSGAAKLKEKTIEEMAKGTGKMRKIASAAAKESVK